MTVCLECGGKLEVQEEISHGERWIGVDVNVFCPECGWNKVQFNNKPQSVMRKEK